MKPQTQAFAYSKTDRASSQKGSDKKWAEEANKWHFNPQIFLYVLIAASIGLALYQSLAVNKSILWLFELKPLIDPPAPGDIAVALGPILALALMIERMLETVFEVFERNWAQVARYGTAASDGARHLYEVLDLYNGQLTTAMDELETAIGGEDPKPVAETNMLMLKVTDAEKLVREASDKMAGLIKDPKYLGWKRTVTIWLGLALGFIVAIISDVGVFEHLNIQVPRLVDMLITGFVIGAGSGPLHSLIGILQSAKATLDSVGTFSSTAALQKEIDDLKEALKKENSTRPNVNVMHGQ